MIANGDLIGTLALLALSALGISLMWFNEKQPIARKASMFLAFPFLLAMAFYMLSIPSSGYGGTFSMNIISNTIYQNTNSTPLAIYAITHSATLHGYLGSTNTSMLKVIDLQGGSVDITGVVYSLTGYNMSAYMLAEPNEYYKFNYTNATFIGEYGG
jgi:hypothetical protein